MLQRIQTVWLLLAALVAAAMFFFPVFGGVLQNGTEKYFLPSSDYIIFICILLLALIPLITIFLFKNRQLQMKLVFVSYLLVIATIALIYFGVNNFSAVVTNNFKTSSYKISGALPFISFIFLVLAFRGIKADEKLVKSQDRLRS